MSKMSLAGLANEVIKTYGEELTFALLEASVLHLHSYMLSEVRFVHFKKYFNLKV